jgi:hypothetical protein
MGHGNSPRAKLLVDLPADRYRILSPSGRAPLAGDEVVLDQGFTSSDGLPMVLAYFPALGEARPQMCRLTNRWRERVEDKVPSPNRRRRGAQLNR